MRKLSLLLILGLFFISSPANAYKVKTFQPLNISPLALPYDAPPEINESYPKVTQLEITLFKRTYENESIYNRLTRIENKVFRRNFNSMPLASRVDNIFANIDPALMYNISLKELARLETKVLGRTYPNDDTESRITRLEKEMLGAMQGGKLTERFNTVKTAAKHYNSYPEIAQSQSVYPRYSTGINPYYTGQRRGINGMLQNVLGAIFGDLGTGTMTGFTPPIYDPYNPYSSYNPYGGFNMNPGVGQQDYFMGNHGGYMNNRNLGSQSSVRILD